MAAAHARVDDPDLFRLYLPIRFPQLFQLRPDGVLLLRLFQIILPVGVFRLAVSLCPQSAKGVFHHIPHDPVRREKLCRRRNIRRTDLDVFLQVGEHLVLRFGVVVLVQPADDLHLILPVLFGNVLHHVSDDAVLTEQILREQQLRPAADVLEHLRQALVQGVALGDDDVLIQPFVFLIFQQFQHQCLVQSVDFQIHRICQHLRLEAAVLVRENADVGRQVVVHLHEPQSNETVEPGVGCLFHGLDKAVRPNPFDQLGTLAAFCGSQRLTVD